MNLHRCFCAVNALAVLFASGSAFAQSTMSIESPSSSGAAIPRESVKVERPFKGKIRLSAFNFTHLSSSQEYFRPSVEPQFGGLNLEVDTEQSMGKGSFNSHGGVIYSVSEETLIPNIQDLNWSREFRDGQKLSVGRKNFAWSESDTIFRRGVWQSRFMWDRFTSSPQGLTGFYFEAKNDRWKSSVFASPIFIPEMAPPFKNKNGYFETKNPWFRPPIARVSLFNKPTYIDYDIIYPKVADIVANPSIAAQTKYMPSKKRDFTLSGAYKPVNQLYFSAPFYLDTSTNFDPSVQRVDVDIDLTPRVVYHGLATMEWRERTGKTEFLMSGTVDTPVDEDKPDVYEYLVQESKGTFIADMAVKTALDEASRHHLLIGIANYWGGDVPVQNSIVRGDYLFERRYDLKTPLLVGTSHRWEMSGPGSLQWDNRMVLDLPQRGAMFSSHAQWFLNPKFALMGGIDLIGIIDTQVPEVEDAFLANYRSNDRVSLGMGYVF